MIPMIDTHVHFWDKNIRGLSWPWLDKDFRSGDHSWTRRGGADRAGHDAVRYTVREFWTETSGLGIAGLVHAHCAIAERDPSQETVWLEQLAAENDGWPQAIIGRGELASPDGASLLQRHRAASGRCGSVRDMAGPAGLDLEACAASLDAAAELGFVIELRTRPQGFAAFATMAERWPDVKFVLSHAGLPLERTPSSLAEWKAAAVRLVECPNWYCKISALCGGSDPEWTLDSIRPWAEACVETFGPGRSMLGTNWPVDRLFGSYEKVLGAYRAVFADLEVEDQQELFYGTAAGLYGIDRPALDSLATGGIRAAPGVDDLGN
ncbi:MAG: amidohydrolase family protein [Acidimicrobiaceae bacterium]|nr:amidohydrolase family protein [Acidimicrobiaceae bacterium]MYF31920.1 amidohydrolase family protein [Acidimicrobiaceae bacterium]MYG77009.1 amidohydrolase family protein [Acidimicrobiaceae bacterium]